MQNKLQLELYLEVRRACRKNDPVGSEELALGAEGDVHQGLLLELAVEVGDEGGLVIVPLQAELLVAAHLGGCCFVLLF